MNKIVPPQVLVTANSQFSFAERECDVTSKHSGFEQIQLPAYFLYFSTLEEAKHAM